MNDYRKWKAGDVKVTSLELDARNPRIPAGPRLLDTRELIAELVQHDDVLDIAKSIAARGYYPSEVMIGLEEGGKKIILEGNRRLAALKLLISQEAAPDASKRRFKELADNMDLFAIEKVPVVFAPSRKAAAPLIANRHTITQIQTWSPVQQARYFRSLVDAGTSVAEVARAVGFTQGHVAEFLRSDLMYQVACSLEDLPKDVQAKVHDPRSFSASTIDRLLDNKGVRDWLGIDFDGEGNLLGKLKPEQFKKGYRRLVSDVVSGKVNSRAINSAKDIANYISGIKGNDVPDQKKKGSFTADDVLKGAGGETPVVASPTRRKPASAKKSRSMIPAGFKCDVKDPRIREVFLEVKKLPLDTYPNSAGVMLRVLFELSLGYYLDKSKKIQPLLAKAKKDGKRPDWYPTLRQLLRHALTDAELTKDLSPLNRKNLNKAVSDDDHIFSIDAMDGIVHNRYGTLSERVLRGLWTSVEDLLRVTLVEYKPEPKTAAAIPSRSR